MPHVEAESTRVANKYFDEHFHHSLASDIADAFHSPESREGRIAIWKLDEHHDNAQRELAYQKQREQDYKATRAILEGYFGKPIEEVKRKKSKAERNAEKSTRRALRHPNAKFL